jgi:hypothetical protein
LRNKFLLSFLHLGDGRERYFWLSCLSSVEKILEVLEVEQILRVWDTFLLLWRTEVEDATIFYGIKLG